MLRNLCRRPNRTILTCLAVLVIAAVGFECHSGTADERAVAPRPSGQGSLALSLDSPKPRVLLGEPVSLTVMVANTGQAVQVVVRALDPYAGYIRYWITDPAGDTRECDTGGADPADPRTQLYPGEQIADTARLLWGDEQPIFQVAGTYHIEATLGRPEDLRSNTLTLEVLEPQGADAEAFPLVSAEQSARFLQLESHQYREGIANLRELVDRYPRSGYTPYAVHALAFRASMEGHFSPGPGQMERIPPDYPKAIRGFERVVREWPDSPVADDAQYGLARTYFDMGQAAEAREALAVFFTRYAPTSEHLAQATYLSERLEWEGRGPNRAETEWVAVDDIPITERARLITLDGPGTVIFTHGETAIVIEAGRDTASMGPLRIPLTHRPRVEGGRLLVPVSFARLLPRLLTRGRELYPIGVREGAGIVTP